MHQIQTFPFGLQSLLDLKGSDLPNLLGDSIQPTIDLTQNYLVNKRESIQFAALPANTIGYTQFPDSVVPVGQLWYVWAYGITVAPGAGAAFTGRPGVQYGPNGYGAGPLITLAASQADRGPATCPILLQPGDGFGFITVSSTLAPNVLGAAAISRLRV
jgi:hypothetical protein